MSHEIYHGSRTVPRESIPSQLFRDVESAPSGEQPVIPDTPYEFDLDSKNDSILELAEGGYITAAIVCHISGESSQKADWTKQDEKAPQIDKFLIVDLRNTTKMSRYTNQPYRQFKGVMLSPDTEFLLVGSNFDPQHEDAGFEEIKRGQTLVVGRADAEMAARLNLGPYTSGQHFSLALDEDAEHLVMTDLKSLNGTNLTTRHGISMRSSEQEFAANPEQIPIAEVHQLPRQLGHQATEEFLKGA